ncbi:FMN-dependent NADH-azoreductase [Mycoplasmopsis mustelae]|uniref:FMN-dependent NADH-azoreductase n=1 Tax=Mycoplasmopsis mustelae TaxID=171289 RepID=A0A4R7UDS0_9BACT|nr:FMN-dependent NADH-azoreductase [Mycoplasmopsis mustelae]TDV24061.1 FMN-dependent NADH-azoreductase [Mycoplasmopsis mustelae]
MQKILLLDGNLINKDHSSYVGATLDYLETKFKSKNLDVQRFDLNDTHSEVFLTKKTYPEYWKMIDSDKWINLLKETDLLVISTSMINFTAAVVVKNFIDSISVADKTFSYKYSKKGDAIGLLTNLNVLIVASQGAPQDWYQWGSHVSWLEGTFKFLGAKKVLTYRINGTKVKPISEHKAVEYTKEHETDLNEVLSKF